MCQIPDDWHKKYAFNCLTNEQFARLQKEYEIGDSFDCECDECGTYTISNDHRCDCGNRRCYFVCNSSFEFEVAVD